MTSTPADSAPAPAQRFDQLDLIAPLLMALDQVGYESPSPIQAATIPELLSGRDLLGQAQTGTGKTAAFALPVLSRIDVSRRKPQALVLAPTRELAIQVAEAFERYATFMPGFKVLPIYGGQGYKGQLDELRRGAHIIVGTPGRVMDHMRRKTLVLDELRHLVLDEADEMLRMGFIDDVEWILQQLPTQRQVALFSATMPTAIKRIAQQYLNEPAEIRIQAKTATAENIAQRYWLAKGMSKQEALARILEVEERDASIIFVRTKTATVELAEALQGQGHAAAPLNGDIPQSQRERTVDALKAGKLDILVATDVVARGLDVERISHVINYDVPYDTEAYVHRIGRTGRAGRSGEAILFITPREKRMLYAIERATRQKITAMTPPSPEAISERRIAKFQQRISDVLSAGKLAPYRSLIEDFQKQHPDANGLDIAAALACLAQGDSPLFAPPKKLASTASSETESSAKRKDKDKGRKDTHRVAASDEPDMERFRIEVGRQHGVQPGNIVGALANEAGLDAEHIGRVKIFDDHSLVDLPEGMPKPIFKQLQRVWVSGQQLKISRVGESPEPRRNTSGELPPGKLPRKRKAPSEHRKSAPGDTKRKSLKAKAASRPAKPGKGKPNKNKPKPQ